MIAVQLFFG